MYSFAQMTGEVNYDELGISFIIPEGWLGQEGDETILLRSNSLPGIVLLATHEYSLVQLKSEAKKGISEGYGTRLNLSGEVEELSDNSIGGEYKGTLEGNAAKAFIIGIVNEHGGYGVTIMAAALENNYSEKYEEIAKQIFSSFNFRKVEKSDEVEEWKSFFSGVRLTYMDSYSSSSYTGGASGGYSTEIKIDLCSEGYFNYGSDHDMTISGSGISGYGNSDQAGAGKWDIAIDRNGIPVLKLNFYNNEVYTYQLTYEDQKTYLNGDRYFRTTQGEFAPNCY